ncbi:MAG: hypothetical protein U1F43_38090 [Myxococcota bacterium]
MRLASRSLVCLALALPGCAVYRTEVRDERVVEVRRIDPRSLPGQSRLVDEGLTVVRDDGVVMTWPGPAYVSGTDEHVTVDPLDGHPVSLLPKASVREVDYSQAHMRSVRRKVRDAGASKALSVFVVAGATALVSVLALAVGESSASMTGLGW